MGGERPRRVTLFAVGVLGLAAYNLLGLWAGLEQMAYLSRLPLAVPPAYLLASRALWSVAFGGLGLGLWRQMRQGRRAALLLLGIYLGQGALERWLFVRTEFAAASWPFQIGLGLLVLGLAAVLLPARPRYG